MHLEHFNSVLAAILDEHSVCLLLSYFGTKCKWERFEDIHNTPIFVGLEKNQGSAT